MVVLLGISTLLLSFALCRRLLPTLTLAEGFFLSPLIATTLIIAAANVLGPVEARLPLSLFSTIVGVLMLLPVWKRDAEENQNIEQHPFWWGKNLFLLSVALYVTYSQFRYLDTDNWIHEPLIGGYTLGIFPPVHPFFPEATMNGHYGRDLLIGALTPHGGDPLIAVWLLNPLLAVCSAVVLLLIFERSTSKRLPPLFAGIFTFYGACVGFRVGLVDTTDGNNGLVYALYLLLMYLMLEVLELLPGVPEKPRPGLWLLAGFILGIYQLIYETHFGLLLMTAATLLPLTWALSSHKKRLLTGVVVTATLALLLATTEGGPITDLVRSKAIGSQAVSGTADDQVSDLNVEQRVSLKFPKQELFKVRATTSDYQRISVGFKSGPFEGSIPAFSPEGYLSIFSPQFLVTHWLPLFLAPLSLFWVLRQRHWAGLSFWIFGTWAYLVPGLIDFGPVYEWEYFRWEFAAGVAWATPLGLLCGDLLSPKESLEAPLYKDAERGWTLRLHAAQWPLFAGLSLAVLGLLPGEKLLNGAIIDVQKHGFPGPLSPSDWRVSQKDLSVTRADIEVARELASRISKGQTVMTNLGQETPFGLWPDCVLSGLTGARVSGRARPPVDRRVHAHPNFHRSMLWKSIVATERLDPLWFSDTDWLVIDPLQGPWEALLQASPHAQLEKEHQSGENERRQLWKLNPPELNPDSPADSKPASMSPPIVLSDTGRELDEDFNEWRSATVYKLQLIGLEALELKGQLRIEVKSTLSNYDPVHYWLEQGPPGSPEVAFVTPLEEGEFEVVGTLLSKPDAEIFRRSVVLDFRKRLSEMTASIEVPDLAAPKSMATLKIQFASQQDIVSKDELDLLLRYKRDGGDYVWELDRLPTNLNLDLSGGGTSSMEWKVMAPWEDGAYILELELLDKHTGLRTPVKLSSPAKLLVVSP